MLKKILYKMFLLTCVFLVTLRLGATNAMPQSSDQSRIIGGVDAPEAYSPHMAVLIIGDRVQIPLCGGSIISKTLVLTAAHCIDAIILPNRQLPPSFHLRVGSNKWNSGGQIVQVKYYHNHPQWDEVNIKYDAGILVLRDRLVLSKSVAVVPLNFKYVGGDEESVMTGWGRTGPKIEGDVIHLQPTPEDLQLIYVKTLTHEQCQQQMKEHAGNVWTPPIQKDVEICTFHSKGSGMCVGDSGSALLLQKTREQIGVVSWGFGCAEGAPDVFVRLYGIRQFLETLLDVYRDR